MLNEGNQMVHNFISNSGSGFFNKLRFWFRSGPVPLVKKYGSYGFGSSTLLI
jgi:hypothetical protein